MLNKDIKKYENRFNDKKTLMTELKKKTENFSKWYKRLLGAFIDGIFFATAQQAYIAQECSWRGCDEGEALISYLIFPGAYLIYLLFFESLFGRTFGKIITQTKVVCSKTKGKPAGYQILMRTIGRLIPFDGFSFLSNRPRGWHDSLAHTEIIDSPLFKPLWKKYKYSLFFGYLPKKWHRLIRVFLTISILFSFGLAIPVIMLLSWIIEPLVIEKK